MAAHPVCSRRPGALRRSRCRGRTATQAARRRRGVSGARPLDVAALANPCAAARWHSVSRRCTGRQPAAAGGQPSPWRRQPNPGGRRALGQSRVGATGAGERVAAPGIRRRRRPAGGVCAPRQAPGELLAVEWSLLNQHRKLLHCLAILVKSWSTTSTSAITRRMWRDIGRCQHHQAGKERYTVARSTQHRAPLLAYV